MSTREEAPLLHDADPHGQHYQADMILDAAHDAAGAMSHEEHGGISGEERVEQHVHVAIIGGGLSGLCCALALTVADPRLRVTVREFRDRSHTRPCPSGLSFYMIS
jgi:heterodisulfide reductase subunit A-like polyferredoxin